MYEDIQQSWPEPIVAESIRLNEEPVRMNVDGAEERAPTDVASQSGSMDEEHRGILNPEDQIPAFNLPGEAGSENGGTTPEPPPDFVDLTVQAPQVAGSQDGLAPSGDPATVVPVSLSPSPVDFGSQPRFEESEPRRDAGHQAPEARQQASYSGGALPANDQERVFYAERCQAIAYATQAEAIGRA